MRRRGDPPLQRYLARRSASVRAATTLSCARVLLPYRSRCPNKRGARIYNPNLCIRCPLSDTQYGEHVKQIEPVSSGDSWPRRFQSYPKRDSLQEARLTTEEVRYDTQR